MKYLLLSNTNTSSCCVEHTTKKLFPYTVVELLKYTNSKVILDICGHHFTQEDFHHITQEHQDALDRIKEVDDYQHMIICTLRGSP